MIKRALDVCIATLAIVLSLPMMAAIALGVLLSMGRPVLFSQLRPGLGGRMFTFVKFRTMTNAVGPDGAPLPDAARVTRFGRWLRRSSLDELPQLFAVLRGDLSLVGPRPLLPEYLPLYSPRQARRHDVRPGVTGWAQVNGRNAVSWQEKLELDVWYVEHRSLWLDLRILFMTAKAVLASGQRHYDGSVPMEKFRGNAS
jgi:sugar transferase EpsL